MAAEVAHGAVGEAPVAIPARSGEIDVVIRPHRGRTDPEVPVELRRHGHGLRGHLVDVVQQAGFHEKVAVGLRLGARLHAPGTRDPGVHLLHLSDRAALDQFNGAMINRRRVHLRAHLRGHVGFCRGLHHDTAFMHIAGQRLLAVDVLARAQGRKDGECVGVLRGRDEDGVDVVHLRVHLAEVLVGAHAGELRGGIFEVLRVHVAHGDHVHQFRHFLRLVDMRSAATARRDEADVHLGVGRLRGNDRREPDHGGSGGEQ